MYHLGVLVDVLLSQNGLIGVTLRSAPGAASTVSDECSLAPSVRGAIA